MSGTHSIGPGYLSVRMNIPSDPPTEVPAPPPHVIPPGTHYQYWQEIAVNEMTIDHDLNFRPAGITLISADGLTRFQGFGASYVGESRVVIYTDIKFRGWVLLS
jgi:hypothetical protein